VSSSIGVLPLGNNENASATVHHHSKGGGGLTTKKATFHDENNAAKTPHRSNKDTSLGKIGGGGGQQQQPSQRRRRAFGRDISDHEAKSRANRGQIGGGGGGGGGDASVALKPTSKLGGGNSKKVIGLPKTTFADGASGANRTRHGGGEPIFKTNVAEPIPVATRWSDEVDVCTEIRSPFVSTGIPKDELFMVTKLRDEAVDLRKKEDDERDRLVLDRHEKHCMEMMRSVHLDDDFGGGVLEGLYAMNDLLESKLPWEEEDGGTSDPAEERRLSGTDPESLWGDILNY
jgi:hypothetical protein